MKRLTDYIKYNESSLISLSEKLVVNKNYNPYTCAPKSFNELRKIIEERYKEQGPGTEQNPINLNNIDVSNIDSFYDGYTGIFGEIKFEYIDISEWDVSKVKDMYGMFYKCEELKSVGDLYNWNVSKVEDMGFMFSECYNLKSVGDLSKWNVSRVKDIRYMFEGCEKLKSAGNLSNWNVSNVENMYNMFEDSGITNIPDWYKE